MGLDPAGHMPEVIVLEENTLQVVDDHIDGPIGGIPDPFVIGSPKKFRCLCIGIFLLIRTGSKSI